VFKTSEVRRVGPAILTNYLVSKVAVDTVVALSLLILLYSAADLIEVKSISGIGFFEILQSYVHKLPSVATLLLPSAAGLGIAYQVSSLHRTGEWEAMEALGVSPKRTILRLLIISACLVPVVSELSFWLAPLSAARFESQIRRLDKNSILCFFIWTRSDTGFVRYSGNGQIDTVIRTTFFSDPVMRWSRTKSCKDKSENLSVVSAWDKRDGWHLQHGFPQGVSGLMRPAASPVVNDLPGQTMTYFELNQAIRDAELMGLSGAPFRAERGLRFAVIIACLMISGGVVAMLIAFRIDRAGPSILLCISSTVVFWLLSAIAWNGAAQDLWSDLWTAFGVPLGFCFLVSAFIWIYIVVRKKRNSGKIR
jgi:hypothetical protein